MKIAILGFGLEGHAAYDYWQDGNDITICDRNGELATPEGVKTQLGEGYLANLDGFDLVVRSPQIHPDMISAASGDEIFDKTTTNLNEFLRVCPSQNVIGVTGTKGKGTTSTLISNMLEAAGKRVHLGGNIGIAPLDLLHQDIQPDDFVVLELSNFQLIDVKLSPHVAVCLMIAPEHLNWHSDYEEYTTAKMQLFVHQKPDDSAIYFADDDMSRHIADASKGTKIPYYAKPGAIVNEGKVIIRGQVICKTTEIQMLGEHNWQNACAAITACWQFTQDVAAIRLALTSFLGLPYRIEFRTDIDDVSYYNDSFASAPPAPLAALDAISGYTILIVGGFDRGLDLSELCKGIAERAFEVKHVLAIGATAEKIAEGLAAANYSDCTVSTAETMDEIVAQAAALASHYQAHNVLLSPGFASFDMFANFEDRGQKFNQALKNLEKSETSQ
jgi:UDP-N-acetylmuramoylalanine--D-glutamate ligase